MKTYEQCPPEVSRRASELIDKFHHELNKAEIQLDFIFASNEDGPAITSGGYAAIGLCKIMGLKDRTMGRGDVEILLDKKVYEDMNDEQKNALLDHELEHIEIQYDKEGAMKTDDLDRPKVKLRKHDYQFGWFTSIAQRHGLNSPEVVQAKMLWDENGQAFFPMLTEGRPKK